jgi:hypothetical protein
LLDTGIFESGNIMATAETAQRDASRQLRYEKAADLLGKWSCEESDYDLKLGAVLDQELKQGGLDCGDRDAPSA